MAAASAAAERTRAASAGAVAGRPASASTSALSRRTRPSKGRSAATSRIIASSHPGESEGCHGSTTWLQPSNDGGTTSPWARVQTTPPRSTTPKRVSPPAGAPAPLSSSSWPCARRSGAASGTLTVGRGGSSSASCTPTSLRASVFWIAVAMRPTYALYMSITIDLSPLPVNVAASMRATTSSTRVSRASARRSTGTIGAVLLSASTLGGSASSAPSSFG
mmetsp:Transcript_77596/g.154107  ORF Transcript_77596/g.154107 Transcript_77596/m.154107 type:complete len:220 (-) Transcript_77596:1196-1855(-)